MNSYLSKTLVRSVSLGSNLARHISSIPDVRIYELGPRDGIQNEPKFIPTEMKVELINQLAESGINDVEATSFVSPKWVKQMGDHKEVMTTLKRKPGVNYPVLVPNLKGYEVAKQKQYNVEEIAIFPSVSEGFSKANLNSPVADALKRFKDVTEAAIKDGIRVRGYLSVVVGCPYDGPTSPVAVAKMAEELLKWGCYEVSLGDTIGVGTAGSVRAMMQECLKVAPADKFALHFHDTYGQALTNVLTGLEFGCKTVDSSIAGLGGCPYARGANGNLATEDLVYFLYGLGVNTNIDLVKLVAAGRYISNFLGKPPASDVNKAVGDKYKDSKEILRIAACKV